MVLAADVLDKRGRMLIPAGKELVAKYLTALPAWGVTRIEVEGDDAGPTAEIEEWVLQAATADVDRIFAKTNRAHPAMEQLAQAAIRRKAHAMQAAQPTQPAGDVA
jgi:hypothetical protein